MDRVFTRVTGRHGRGLQEKAGRRLLMAVAHELAAGRPVVVERGRLGPTGPAPRTLTV